MLTLKWSIKALIDFDEAQAYIAQETRSLHRPLLIVSGRRAFDSPRPRTLAGLA